MALSLAQRSLANWPVDYCGRATMSKTPADDERDITDIFPAIDPEGPVNDDPTDDLPPVEPVIGRSDTVPESEKQVIRLEIPFRTILRVALSLFAIWLLMQISDILLLVVIALILTMALIPPTRRLEQQGLPRVMAAGLVFAVLIGLIAGFFGLILPPLITQIQSVVDNFPEYTQQMERFIARYPSVYDRYLEIREEGFGDQLTLPWDDLIAYTTELVRGIANIFFVLTLSFYLLIEGERSYTFVARYITPRLRFRLRRAFPELTRVVSGYVIGQLINSTLFAAFVYILLLATGTPEPLLMAALAFVLDAVPIIGAPLATIPAVILAATVSPTTAIVVLAAYIIYQQVEGYVIIPRVFGNTLQVSALAILLGVLIGGQLLGIVGIILSLPLTASIPVLERVWREDLPDQLTRDMI
jgi:predicted PurR-regulated permease PerM